jgi:hypothetical protein
MKNAFTLAIVSFLFFCNLPTEDTDTDSKDLNLSKATLKVHNNPVDTSADKITMENTSDHSIILDSAFVLFEAFNMKPDKTDTLEVPEYTEAHWVEDSYGDFGWYLHKIDSGEYKLIKDFFSPNDTATPLQLQPNESCVFLDFQLGINLVSERIPEYPKYVKGLLQLYFSNKQVVEIKLYSDDLRSN